MKAGSFHGLHVEHAARIFVADCLKLTILDYAVYLQFLILEQLLQSLHLMLQCSVHV